MDSPDVMPFAYQKTQQIASSGELNPTDQERNKLKAEILRAVKRKGIKKKPSNVEALHRSEKEPTSPVSPLKCKDKGDSSESDADEEEQKDEMFELPPINNLIKKRQSILKSKKSP